jgi:type II secretory pathway pseudopilin PulG
MRKLPTLDARRDRSSSHRAFTLLDLIAALAVLAILAATFAPALAKSGGKAGRINCINNKRHIQAACAMYSAEFNDWLMPNAPAGYVGGWCGGNSDVDWGSAPANINPNYYTTNCLGPYVKDLKAYKCPNDKIPSDNGDRIRSISMNGAICGDLPNSIRIAIQGYMGVYLLYSKTSDLTKPGPANTWIFCDESMYSLEDGYFQLKASSPDYPNVPAAYDIGGNCFSFADAHVEYRKWVWPGVAAPFPGAIGAGVKTCPYAYGVEANSQHWGSAGTDVDWLWLTQHASALPGS